MTWHDLIWRRHMHEVGGDWDTLLNPVQLKTGLRIGALISEKSGFITVWVLLLRRTGVRTCGNMNSFKQQNDIIFIGDFEVTPRLRNQGVGEAVLSAFIHWASESGIRVLRANLSRTDAIDGSLSHLIRFYGRHGFRLTKPWDSRSIHGLECVLTTRRDVNA